ncbi:MAG: hypothetical protein EOP83_27435 [Verrucomicrobiaceae bacterium]|nr:MAG: hypothetical protein EOP83_27435 [Verrucomicrobiaceae bacterium]
MMRSCRRSANRLSVSVLNSLKIFVAGLLLGLAGCATTVRLEAIEGKTISEVSIRYRGPKTVDEVRLRTHVRTVAGSPYKSERIDEDIKSLYESALVNDVRVLAEPKRGGVEVIYEVETRGGLMCCGPGFASNTVFSDQRLAKETGWRAGQKIDGPNLGAAARRLEAFYHEHGYPGAKVSTRTQPGAEANLDFIFIIEEGPGPS